MKKAMQFINAGLCMGALLFAPKAMAEAELLDGIVAVVGNNVITLSELEDSKIVLQNDPTLTPEEREDLDRAALNRMIEDQVINIAAAREGLYVTDDEVQRSIDGWLRQNNADQAALLTELARQGISFEDYQTNMRKHLLQSKFIDYMIHPKVSISEAQIREYYAKEVGAIKEESAAQVWIIYLPFEGGNSAEETRELAEDLRAKIIDGEDFGDLAKTYSRHPSNEEGGLLGTFKMGELFALLDQAAFDPDSLVVSKSLNTNDGIFLLRSEPASSSDDTLSYNEARPKIEGLLFQMELQRQLEKWLEEAKRETHVEVLDTEISR